MQYWQMPFHRTGKDSYLYSQVSNFDTITYWWLVTKQTVSVGLNWIFQYRDQSLDKQPAPPDCPGHIIHELVSKNL